MLADQLLDTRLNIACPGLAQEHTDAAALGQFIADQFDQPLLFGIQPVFAQAGHVVHRDFDELVALAVETAFVDDRLTPEGAVGQASSVWR